MNLTFRRTPEPRRDRRRTPEPEDTVIAGSGVPTPTQLSPRAAAVIRRSATDDPLGGRAVPPAIETALRRRRGTGTPLPPALAPELSAGFGTDLSGVRLHTDPEAARISGRLQATAFTRGQDIYFGTGAYRPESSSGRSLLAHELAHVVQQRGPVPSSDVVGRADDPAERQADELAAQVLRRPALIRRYPVDKKNTKANKLLRDRYIKVKDPDDADHYGAEFDERVLVTETIEAMELFVAKLEADKAARRVVVPPTPTVPAPSTGPAASLPVPSVVGSPVSGSGPAKKEKPKVTTYTVGPSGYVAKAEPVVDPYAGLSVKLRGLAVLISGWKKNSMDGTSASLSPTEQAQLQTWVESRETPSGKQKYVVNIGPGTGTYTGTQQFKVSGFGNVGGKAPTFHITL